MFLPKKTRATWDGELLELLLEANFYILPNLDGCQVSLPN
jgi:hypothetical protein